MQKSVLDEYIFVLLYDNFLCFNCHNLFPAATEILLKSLISWCDLSICTICGVLSVSQQSSQLDVTSSPATGRGTAGRDIELLQVPPISMFSRRSLPELKCTCSLGSPAGSSWKHQCSVTDGMTLEAPSSFVDEHKESCAVRRRSQMVSVPNIRTSSSESDQVVLPGSMQLRHRYSSNSSTETPPGGHCRSVCGLDSSKRKYLDLPLSSCTYERSASCEEPIQSVCMGATAEFIMSPNVDVTVPHCAVLPSGGESIAGDNKLVDDMFRCDGEMEQDNAPWPPHLSPHLCYPISSDGSLDLRGSTQCNPPPRRCHSNDTPQFDVGCSSSSLATSCIDTDQLQCVTDSGDTSLVTLDIPDACDDDDEAHSMTGPERLPQTFDDVPTLIILGEMPSTKGNRITKDAEDIV